MSGTVEQRFLYGVHLGPTVYPFRTIEPLPAVIPWTGERLLEADDAELDRWPGLARWWEQVSLVWMEHRSKKNTLTLAGRFDYHRGLSSQADALDDLRVVYAASGQYLAASIVQDPRAFVEHKLYWCRARNLDEARYLTAVLNAPVLGERIVPLQSRGEHNPRDIDKYVWALPIPRFDPNDDRHLELVELAVAGEKLAAQVEMGTARFEHIRRDIRAAVVSSGIGEQLDRLVDLLLFDAVDT